VEVEMHLPGGYTRIVLTRTLGQGMANGGISWEVPTKAIPPELRGIGNRFLVHGEFGASQMVVSTLPRLDRSRALAVRAMRTTERLEWPDVARAYADRFDPTFPVTNMAGMTIGWLAAQTLGEDLNSPTWQ